MANQWVNTDDHSGLEALERVQRSLTVNLIMAPRKHFAVCRCDEKHSDVADRNLEHNYSFFPVEDDNGERILGLYDAQRWFDSEAPENLIGDDFKKFSEDLVIGADESIIDFVKEADEHPTRLVVSRNGVAGLVSLSDMQLLPVRAALFTLITRLEMTMARRIKEEFSDPKEWLVKLSEDRRARIEEQICKAKKVDQFVSEVEFSQLKDKSRIIVNERLIYGEESKKNLNKKFEKIRELRDDISHANNYAASPSEARKTCRTVRSILGIIQSLSKTVQS